MKVVVIESNYPEDFYEGRLDGALTHELLKLLQIRTTLRFALDKKHFLRAIRAACRSKVDVVHISCHGSSDGIALTDNTPLSWDELAHCFQGKEDCPKALIMSSCCGIAVGIAEAFVKVEKRPTIIFGSTDARHHDEYAVAWALLYREFNDGVTREAGQTALQKIVAVVNKEFRYRRWDDNRKRYLTFPPSKKTYEIGEVAVETKE